MNVIPKSFSKTVSISNTYFSRFVFEDEISLQKWLNKDFKELKKQYPKIEYSISDLPNLKVGESCNVHGDGDEVYKILKLIKYSENRYGFSLDSGFSEEVAKCHRKYIL